MSVALSVGDPTIEGVARAFFRLRIHWKEAATFDLQSFSQIVEHADDLTRIAVTFLSEMARANATE
jgi:hypothetical protein